MSTEKRYLATLMAHSSLHAGTGQALDVIDLPIQREGHTGYPCLYGSTLKGALRAADGWQLETELFDPEGDAASDHAGALLVGDARLLLLPVRSLTTHFKWVTCAAVLNRLATDLKRLGTGCNWAPLQDVPQDKARMIKPEDIFLEEYHLKGVTESVDELNDIAKDIADIVPHRNNFAAELATQFVIVSNDVFAYICKNNLPVHAHIAINSETKTVKGGALWYEESLPSETLMYANLVLQKSRKKDGAAIETLAEDLQKLDNRFVQVGGNETVGMGWCDVALIGG